MGLTSQLKADDGKLSVCDTRLAIQDALENGPKRKDQATEKEQGAAARAWACHVSSHGVPLLPHACCLAQRQLHVPVPTSHLALVCGRKH